MRTSPRPDPALASGTPSLRAALLAVVRRRVPEHEAEDLVQEVFAEALVSPSRPADPEALVRWLHGIARHKVADLHRSRARARGRAPAENVDVDAIPAPSRPDGEADARALYAWAEREVGASEEARATLALLVREGDGEKLEHLAEELAIPAPRLRKRVSRLRAELRARWIAAAAAAVLLGVLALWVTRRPPAPRPIVLEPDDGPVAEGRRQRRLALERCPALAPRACLDALDAARGLDPEGDGAPAVREVREAAGARLRLEAPPVPSSSSSSSSSSSDPPAPSPSAPTKAPAPVGTEAPPPVAPSLGSMGSSDSLGPSGSSGTGAGGKTQAPARAKPTAVPTAAPTFGGGSGP